MSMATLEKTTDLGRQARALGIRYFLVSFVDLFGSLRARLVPARAISDMQRHGTGFAGFATWLDMTPADPDVYHFPDPRSLAQLPWQPEIGWLTGDLWMAGRPVEAVPRRALQRQLARAKLAGCRMKSSVQCEFSLLEPQAEAITGPRHDPHYTRRPLVRHHPVISEIRDCMFELGWAPCQGNHGSAHARFEMNWHCADTLITADRHVFFQFMVESIAEKHGLRATFMPRPSAHGNACHARVSMWDRDGRRNLFLDKPDAPGLSRLGGNFLGGLTRHARELCAFFNPAVNGYQRSNAGSVTTATLPASNPATRAGNNHTHRIHVSGTGYLELCLMDGAANPYLLQAGVLAAGLTGIRKRYAPGKQARLGTGADLRQDVAIRALPANLREALHVLDRSKALRAAMGDELIDSFLKLKLQEWNDYTAHPGEWERRNTIDC